MKKITKTVLAAAASLAISVSAIATTRTVNNNTPSPGQFSTIQAAITAASAGDTILVKASPTSYGDFTINKKLHIIGEGWQLPGNETIIGTPTITSVNASAGSIRGMDMYNFNFSTSFISNYNISKCHFNIIDFAGLTSDSLYNFTISESVTTGNISLYNTVLPEEKFYNLTISNNIFTGYNNAINASNSYPFIYAVNIKNNLFIGGSSTTNYTYPYQDYPTNLIYSNNIFYNINFTTTGTAVFNNNITYSNAGTVTMPVGSLGIGNLTNTDPMLTAVYTNGSGLDLSPYDGNTVLDIFSIQSGSPADNAGTDGTDIGLTGGLYPLYTDGLTYLTGRPAVPYIQSLQFTGNNATNPGGTLNVQLKAKKVN